MLPSEEEEFEEEERFHRYLEVISYLKEHFNERGVTLVDNYGDVTGKKRKLLREQLTKASYVLVPLCEFACTEENIREAEDFTDKCVFMVLSREIEADHKKFHNCLDSKLYTNSRCRNNEELDRFVNTMAQKLNITQEQEATPAAPIVTFSPQAQQRSEMSETMANGTTMPLQPPSTYSDRELDHKPPFYVRVYSPDQVSLLTK